MIQQFKILISLFCIVAAVDLERVRNTVEQAKAQVWDQLVDNEWCFPTYLGTMFLSEYYFEIKALNLKSKFNQAHFTQLLLSTQNSDGSWDQVTDAYIETGQLDATVFNYWYLKSVGVENLESAKEWILANGGLEGTQTMTKFKLAAFGQYPWSKLFDIPLFIFYPHLNPLYIKDITAQWVYPHMVALAYLQNVRKVFNVGANISELYVGDIPIIINEQYQGTPGISQRNLVKEMLSLRQPLGSFGGYTISTLLSMMALQDFKERTTEMRIEIDQAMVQGLEFVEFNYFNSRVPYQGSLDDGRWWDTILISWALLESGEDIQRLRPVVDNMIAKGVQVNGGIEYGFDFGYAPDADDTGLLLQVLSYFGNEYVDQIRLNSLFLLRIQNIDGGFPAFDKGKSGNNPLIKAAFKYSGIDDSAEIFDPSSPDVTAHILEGLASVGEVPKKLLRKAIHYLKDTQVKFGSWEGRWGINYIYAAGAVLPALKKINYNLNEPWIKKAVNWLVAKQNEDGGFGETTLSYNDPQKYNGVGVSTVTQTAWALLGMIAVQEQYEVQPYISRAVTFLLDEFAKEGCFIDKSVVGTGHRGLLYLQYPSYAQAFPLLALTRYLSSQQL